ncbi:hypothetical protein AB0K15_06665 [Amycolatopsis sp. NPDC049253]|uniref:flavoprotein n=1 Tax=Amycolatopsis sp. NPDC049253 TaxID=3155274 RepID=UPI0034158741
MRLIVGMTGATGAPFGIRPLEVLRAMPDVETHLVLSRRARTTLHLENLLALTRMGAVVVPPMPAFSHRPQSLDDVLDHVVARVLDQFGLSAPAARRWTGLNPQEDPCPTTTSGRS